MNLQEIADQKTQRTDTFVEEQTKNSSNSELDEKKDIYPTLHEENKRFLFEIEETYSDDKNKLSDSVTSDFVRKSPLDSSKYLKLFKAVQKWKGYVEDIEEEGFTARLKDISSGGTDETGWFSFNEISDNEKESLELGKSFYLSVGYSEYLGQVEKVSRIRFQKVVDWDLGLVENVNDKVNDYLSLFDEDDQ